MVKALTSKLILVSLVSVLVLLQWDSAMCLNYCTKVVPETETHPVLPQIRNIGQIFSA